MKIRCPDIPVRALGQGCLIYEGVAFMNRPRQHVAMLIQAYLPRLGGAERQLAALTPLLRARGIDVTVITRRYPGLSRFEVIDGVPVHRLPVPGPKPLASMSFTLLALPLLRRLAPDVIHAHELLSPTTTAVVAKRWLGTPVVAKVLRGGVLGDLAKLEQKPLGRWRMQSFKQRVDGFIVISQEIDAELAAWGIAPDKRFFVPNGVDTRRFSPVPPAAKADLRRQLGLDEGETAVYTGRLAAEKQVDQLITLWPKVREAFAGAQLLILGSGPEEARLVQMAGEGVRFVGQVDDVAPYLQAADLFVLPSATEGLSNAMLEALATGLPVIATNVGGAADVITQQQNGWLIPAEQSTSQTWLEAILTLFSRAEMRAELGGLGRQKVVADYGLTATADKLAALYGRVTASIPTTRYSHHHA
jgi:glycosyltransferase involved in cell wall biosynthesis